MKFEIGEKVRYVGSQPGHKNEIVTIIATYTTIEVHPSRVTHSCGIKGRNNWIHECAELYIEKIKEKEMDSKVEIKPEDIICHALDPRVEGLMDTEVVMGDHMSDFDIGFNIRVRPLIDVDSEHEYPFSTGIVRYKFIAPYAEPVKQYRWFEGYDSNELRDTLGKDVKYRLNAQTCTRRVVKYTEGLHGYVVIELDSGKQLTAKELFDNYTFIDGGICGVEI